jgi:hypothetical protein
MAKKNTKLTVDGREIADVGLDFGTEAMVEFLDNREVRLVSKKDIKVAASDE